MYPAISIIRLYIVVHFLLLLILFFPIFFFSCYGDHRDLHSFPTRRSSDLPSSSFRPPKPPPSCGSQVSHPTGDRKSTRLNSSHMSISYAVFCLKKKTTLARATRCARSPPMWTVHATSTVSLHT